MIATIFARSFVTSYAGTFHRARDCPFHTAARPHDRRRHLPGQVQGQGRFPGVNLDPVHRYPPESFRFACRPGDPPFRQGVRPHPVRLLHRPSGRSRLFPLVQVRRRKDESPGHDEHTPRRRSYPGPVGRHGGRSQDHGGCDVRCCDQHPGSWRRPADLHRRGRFRRHGPRSRLTDCFRPCIRLCRRLSNRRSRRHPGPDLREEPFQDRPGRGTRRTGVPGRQYGPGAAYAPRRGESGHLRQETVRHPAKVRQRFRRLPNHERRRSHLPDRGNRPGRG